jgi:hypothetical protein
MLAAPQRGPSRSRRSAAGWRARTAGWTTRSGPCRPTRTSKTRAACARASAKRKQPLRCMHVCPQQPLRDSTVPLCHSTARASHAAAAAREAALSRAPRAGRATGFTMCVFSCCSLPDSNTLLQAWPCSNTVKPPHVACWAHIQRRRVPAAHAAQLTGSAYRLASGSTAAPPARTMVGQLEVLKHARAPIPLHALCRQSRTLKHSSAAAFSPFGTQRRRPGSSACSCKGCS